MYDSTNNKKDFIKLIHSTAELNSFTTESSIEFLKSEGVDVYEIVSAGLNRINELK